MLRSEGPDPGRGEADGVDRSSRRNGYPAGDRTYDFDRVYDCTPVALCLLDRDYRFLRVNERCATLHGRPAADHMGRHVREIFPTRLVEQVEAVLDRVIESGEPILDIEAEGVAPARPTERMVCLVSCYPFKASDGAVSAVAVAVQDITRRKQAEEALQESEGRLASILGSAIDSIVVIDGHYTITLFNPAAEAVFRCPADEAIGTSFERFTTDSLRRSLGQCIRDPGRNGAKQRTIWAPKGLRAARAGGEEFPIEATISPGGTGEHRLFTIILRDLDDRYRAERRIQRLQTENLYLREEVGSKANFQGIIGLSPRIRAVVENIESVARTNATVLITGETGTGKELVARAIHENSRVSANILVTVNCAALPAGVIESELFGHEKGAFTGAISRKIGRFETADGGTIFLDEIGDLPLELQAKLLRVLQVGEFERVGDSQTQHVDVRVVAATNRDLGQAVEQQLFRADLYYRLDVFPIEVPPLRERKTDIPLLVRHFVMLLGPKLGKTIRKITQQAMDTLVAYHWPGNVRELQNVLERGIILSRGPELEHGDWLPTSNSPTKSSGQTLEDVQRRHILRTLEVTGWRVSGRHGAAEQLDIKPTTLEARMKKLGIRRPR